MGNAVDTLACYQQAEEDDSLLFDAIYVTPNPDVRKPLNNQPTIKLSIDAKSDDTNSLMPLGDPDPKMFNISPHIQEEWKEVSLTRENIGGESSDQILNIRPHIQEKSKELSLTKEKIGGESSVNESNYSEFSESTSRFSEFSEKVNIHKPVCNLLEQELAEKSSNLEQVDSEVMAMAHELAMNIHNAQLLAKQKELNSTRQSLKEKVDSEQLLRATVASLTAESSGKSDKISSLQMELRQLGFFQDTQTSENDELATQITTPGGTVTSLSSETNRKSRSKISNPPIFNFLRTATH